ncbi:MAG TPA: LysR substrate-binding domain-containing protein [Burkholderiaceae bacterium]|nr:LysR substrate-binding domain-containing protein [Burkholderiaceae bacterium]
MDLKQLEYFVQVAELGSYTRAANRLAVVQSALSRQVRALEVELRQALFIRTGRGVTLTEPGKRLLEHGRGILQQVERARHDIESRRGEAGGHVVIGLPPSVSRTLTGPLVKSFRSRLPNATLSVVEGLSNYVLEWLTIGRVDCAVVYNVARTPAVDLQPVLDETLYLVSARAVPGQGRLVGAQVTLADVARNDLVIPSQPHSVRMLLESALAGAGLAPRVALEIESVPAILDLVQHDGLHAVLALNAVEASGHAEAFRARPIGPPRLKTTLWIATSAQRPRGPLLERTGELLREMLLAQRA